MGIRWVEVTVLKGEEFKTVSLTCTNVFRVTLGMLGLFGPLFWRRSDLNRNRGHRPDRFSNSSADLGICNVAKGSLGKHHGRL
jgi:hypothetical protein